MLKNSFILIFYFFSLSNTFCNDLEKLGNLIGNKWQIISKWENGKVFKQEHQYEWGLNKTIIKSKTFGTINNETEEFGLRSEGIRSFDLTENKIKFWEFDVFGGITKGDVILEGNNIHYEYKYEINGKLELMRDSWIFINKDKYEFVVSKKSENTWEKLLSNEINRTK